MTRKMWAIAGTVVMALAGVAAATQSYWMPQRAVAQAPAQRGAARGIPVEVATAVRKTMPVHIEALGSVTPIANVNIKSRVDSEIVGVHFADGAKVKQGDLLVTLDSRSIEAEIKRVEAVLTGAKAQLDQAERDVQRYTELMSKNATTLVTLQNAKTQVNILRATVGSSIASLESLNVQLSFCTIRAPISGRISQAMVKIGNYVRSADTTPIATIIQTAPLYVSFTVPQRMLPDIRQAIAAETATVEARVPGTSKHASGTVTMIENTVDPATGMATVRATMPNQDELLWPGTLVNVELTLREEEAVAVPSVAVQVSQTGEFVFVVTNNQVHVRPVTVSRVVGNQSVIASGLEHGETVITEGHLLLREGAQVAVRPRRAGA
jgi:RND family efflux transporter MFP subunit